MSTDIWLALAVAGAGLWSGLLLTVTTILHPMFDGQDDTGFVADLRTFLPIACRSPTNYVLVTVLMVTPVGALWAMRDLRGTLAFALTLAGLVLTLSGPFFVSRFLAEPDYDVILGWRPAHDGAQSPAPGTAAVLHLELGPSRPRVGCVSPASWSPSSLADRRATAVRSPGRSPKDITTATLRSVAIGPTRRRPERRQCHSALRRQTTSA